MAETCAHEGCTCEAREDGYCSDYCAQPAVADESSTEAAPDHEGHGCHCGHAACDASATAPA
jgi:hypothetical protein